MVFQLPFFRGCVYFRESIVICPDVTIPAASQSCDFASRRLWEGWVAFIATLKGRKISQIIGGFKKVPTNFGVLDACWLWTILNVFSFNLNLIQETFLKHILPNIAGFWITWSLKFYEFLPPKTMSCFETLGFVWGGDFLRLLPWLNHHLGESFIDTFPEHRFELQIQVSNEKTLVV